MSFERMTYTPVYGACCRIIMVKAFPYRAEALEEFSSTYTFAPINTPSNDTQWSTFVDYIRAVEQTIYNSQVKFHRAYGYDHNDPHRPHVYVKDWAALNAVEAGTFAPVATDVKGAGDQAACVEWRFTLKSSAGKPIYSRKYCHEPYMVSGGGDNLATDYLTVLDNYGQAMGAYLGGPYSTKYPTATAGVHKVLPYVTTRTLKRRGKRPLTGQ